MRRISVFFVLLFCAAIFAQEIPETKQQERQIIERYWTIFEQSPRRGTAFDRICAHYAETNRMSVLQERCRQITEKSPDAATGWLMLGLVSAQCGENETAIQALEKATMLEPTDALAPFYLGEVYLTRSHLQEAVDSLELSLARSLDNTQKTTPSKDVRSVLLMLGRGYERLGDRKKSAEVWNKLEESFPEDRDILVRIAETLEEEGHFEEALRRYRQLIKLSENDDFARVQYILAATDVKNELGEKQSALDDLVILLQKLDEKSWQINAVRNRIANLQRELGQTDQAVETLRRILRSNPTDTEILSELAETLYENDDVDESLEIFWQVFEQIENVQEKLAVVSRMAKYYRQSQRFDLLIERLRQYGQEVESRRESAFYLSSAFLTVSDYESARRTLEAILNGPDDSREIPNEIEDTVLFAQLATIAEIQGDMPAAIRYREMIPEQLKSSPENGQTTQRTFSRLATAPRPAIPDKPSSTNIRHQEQSTLKCFANDQSDERLKKRAEKAVERLAGYQLKSDEFRDIRRVLNILGRKDDDAKMRNRMLAGATDLNTQAELLSELRSGDAEMREQAVRLAMKIYRILSYKNTATMRNDDYSRHVFIQALEVLKKADKLNEIVLQSEVQWQAAPGSFDLLTNLADIYYQSGRQNDAREIAILLGERIPNDAVRMHGYANLLQNIGMNDESVVWVQKSLSKNPEQIFRTFWQYEEMFRRNGQLPKLIDLLMTFDPLLLVEQSNQFFYRVADWLNDKDFGDKAEDLIEYMWKMDGVEQNERLFPRVRFLQVLAVQPIHTAFYPMFHEVIMNRISAPREFSDEYPLRNPFQVDTALTTRCCSPALTLFDIAEKNGILEELYGEFKKIVESHEAVEPNIRATERYRYAKSFLAMAEIRLDNADVAVKMIERLVDEDRKNEHSDLPENIVLGLELSKLDHPEANRLAIEMFENVLARNPNTGYEMIVTLPLHRLYLKTDKTGVGRNRTLERLREYFTYLKLSDENFNHRIDNREYSVRDLQNHVFELSKMLFDAGHVSDLSIVYKNMYDGQDWVEAARQRHNYRYEELDRISKQLSHR